MDTRAAIQPSTEEVLNAFQDGYRSIDDGDDFWRGFDQYLRSRGYDFVPDAPCICPDRGRHGHLPECGWNRS